MSDVISFPILDDMAIEIKRTDEFMVAASELSNFLAALPLSREDNDKLVSLMVKQVNVAETSAFTQGLATGYEFGVDEAEER